MSSYGFDDGGFVLGDESTYPPLDDGIDSNGEMDALLNAEPDPWQVMFESISDVQNRVAELERARPASAVDAATSGGGVRRWCWRGKEHTAEGAQILQAVRLWVDWVNTRYFSTSAQSIPPCWFRHNGAVEELTALYVAWEDAYSKEEEFSDSLVYWHDRLWAVMHRLEDVFSDCRAGHYEAPVSCELTDEGEFQEFLGSMFSH